MDYFVLKAMRGFFKIVDGHISSTRVEYSIVMVKNQLNLNNLYIVDFDDQNLLVINSFKNITAIVDKSLIGDSQIPDNLAELLETPNSSNEMEFKRLVDSCSYENIYTAFIIAITYRCNLHCIYCYQQNDKTLSKHIISDENLSLIFETISKYHQDHPNEIIDIGLFGGEPLLPETRDVVKKSYGFLC